MGKPRIMCNQQQRHLPPGTFGKEQIGDLPAGLLVEIAGRLVGDQDRRLRREGAGERHPLLFAAGEFAWIMRHAVGEPDIGEFALGPLEGVGVTGKFQRHGDVFQRRHVRDQVEGLEDDADVLAAECRELVLGQTRQFLAGNLDHALVGTLEPGEHHQKRRLAGAGWPDDADRFAPRDVEIEALQNMHGAMAATEGQMNVSQPDCWFCQVRRLLYARLVERARQGPALYGCAMQRFQPILAALTMLSLLVAPFVANAQDAPDPAGRTPLQVVAFGDSLSAGYGVGPGESFPEQLQKALRDKGYAVEVANAGVSGDTTTGGLARVEWSVPQSADLVIVELGANDALRGVSPEIADKNLDAILKKLKGRGQAILLTGMIAPPNMGDQYAKGFDPIYADLAKKYDVPLYPFFLDGVAAKPGLNQDDAMHPNAKGVAIIVARMLPMITEALDKIEAAKASG